MTLMADVPDTAEVTERVLSITDDALAKVLEVRGSEPDPESQALWVEVSGESGGAFTYDMYFRPVDEVGADDAVHVDNGLTVVVAADSIDKLRGATLDFTSSGMVMQNPNTPAARAPRPAADLSGETAQSVIKVLEEQINPAIAAHGGWAELVAVEDGVAYLRLQGGCQGCGLATVTLSQGIEVAILDTVPEITSVVDVTDHASGTNPYFEAAKK